MMKLANHAAKKTCAICRGRAMTVGGRLHARHGPPQSAQQRLFSIWNREAFIRTSSRPSISAAATSHTVNTQHPFQCRSYTLQNTIERERQDKLNKGAFAVLKALNEVHEKDSVQVAKLVSSLEALLPMAQWEEEHLCYLKDNINTMMNKRSSQSDIKGAVEVATSDQHQPTSSSVGRQISSDPAFFSFPLYLNESEKLRLGVGLTGRDVRAVLSATRHGKRIAVETLDVLLKTAAWYMRTTPSRSPKVVRLPPLQEGQSLTVIGDLHGSLSDLEAVLGMTGEPSASNLLVFNGDLADRGDHGMEVIAVVCTLLLAYPEFVFINRGNHEDLALSVAYGLAAELQHKYGSSVFRQTLGPRLDAFFCSLPLATVIQDDALIVHAGPPPPGVTLDDVQACLQVHKTENMSRTIRTSTVTTIDGKVVGSDPTEEIIESLLWSDPEVHEMDGIHRFYQHYTHGDPYWKPNTSRGAGFKFDERIVREYLQSEGLCRMIRSHEAVHDGCAHYTILDEEDDHDNDTDTTLHIPQPPPSSSSQPLTKKLEFFTVFSASRYPYKEGFNRAAILKLFPHQKHSILRYAVEDDEPTTATDNKMIPASESLSAQIALEDLRRALRDAVAPHGKDLLDAIQIMNLEGVIPFDEALGVLQQTLQLEADVFKGKSTKIAIARALTNAVEHEVPPDTIELEECIYQLMEEIEQEYNDNEGSGDSEEDGFHPDMAPHYPWLRAVFELVDVNHDGVIEKAEWQAAVDKINEKESVLPNLLPNQARRKPILLDADETWKLLDLDGDGKVKASDWDQLAKVLCR